MKYYGKEKCRILKEIRAEIARQNDIEWVVEACTHKGNCRGTCPKCEAEVRQLEKALARREALGKTVAVVGISAGLALSVTGCNIGSSAEMGDMAAPEEFSEMSMMGDDQPAESETQDIGIVLPGEAPYETDTETDDESGIEPEVPMGAVEVEWSEDGE